jgi:hypothetical protein
VEVCLLTILDADNRLQVTRSWYVIVESGALRLQRAWSLLEKSQHALLIGDVLLFY